MKTKNIVGLCMGIVLVLILSYLVYKQVKEYHLQDDPMLYTLKGVLEPMLKEYGINSLKLYRADKSFTINKEKIFLCLYDDEGNYYPINMLIYVILHEIAHYINKDDVGHTEKFHAKFEELLSRATSLGIYNPSIPIIKNYCNSG